MKKLYYLEGQPFLEKHMLGFSEERSDTKRIITRLIFHSHVRHYSEHNGEYIGIPVVFMEKFLGCNHRTFNRINKKYNLFVVDEVWRQGVSRRMQYTDVTRNLIDQFYLSMESKKLMQTTKKRGNITECRVRKIYKVIEVGKLMIYNVIPVDMEALRHYIDNSEGRKRSFACQIYGFSNTEQFGWGMYPQVFEKSDNNRVTGVGGSLQNLDRDIREAALNGYYDYDFKNAHFAILEATGDYPTIKDYVSNTKERRNTVTKEVGISYEDTKRCLLAMLYGGNRGKNENKCAIASYIGKDKVDAFFDHRYVDELRAECREASKELLGCDKIDYSELSYQLTTIEAKILEDVTEGTIIHLAMFDGFVSNVPYDTDRMAKIIYDRYEVITEVTCRVIDYWGGLDNHK